MKLNAKTLRIALYDKGITQKDLSYKSGISRATMNAVACGRSCTYETGKKIADALGMKLEDLLEKR
ncbi:helix-turn-helix transcriptional regulator [Faecalicoccus pleomorphus]|uniref:helix-turn-helix transcriptional regulator n=1 Tax=Faecalicoccus pleomorphus TaxID=1323 RepID=UPI00195FA24F|nr:helix-turn-helix transcriptional regulator [Faecalicoccus pleomorphus]MBM6808568.1 helix-turn-helix transcriptional regulator [Faecalicoccus pleomorphus]